MSDRSNPNRLPGTRAAILIAALLLFLTALAKLISGLGSSPALRLPDPILAFPFRYVFWGVGLVELFVALFCFFGSRIGLKAGLIAWLASSFVVYRVGLLLIGYHKPCGCMGNLTDLLHITPRAADNAMKVVLAYLLIVSYVTLFRLWRERRNSAESQVMAEESVPA